MAIRSGARPINASYSANEKWGTKSTLVAPSVGPGSNGSTACCGATEYTLYTPERERISNASIVSLISAPRGPERTTAIFFAGSGVGGAGNVPEYAGTWNG